MGSEQSHFASGDPTVKRNQITFTINKKVYSINTTTENGITPTYMLVDFIRDKAGLKGTKFTCREGGCGACVVSVKSRDPATGSEVVRAVNACLTPVFACDGWEIKTVEALGNHKAGYHQIQERLVAAGGTQCGYCTPGMVMNMYALKNGCGKEGLTMRDIEDAFDGNICRCTGYRPIMDAFKTFAKDAPPHLESLKLEPGPGTKCAGCPCQPEQRAKCGQVPLAPTSKLHLTMPSGEEWIRPDSLDSLFEAIQRLKTAELQFRFVAGNTGVGVYRDVGPSSNYIDLNSVPDLKAIVVSKEKLTLGGGCTLANAIQALCKAAEFDEYKGYAQRVVTHIKRIANTPVRNAGTLAGNLMLKHKHQDFPSDIFTILEGLGAKLVIASAPNLKQEVLPSEFLGLDMSGRVILAINFPQLKEADGWVYRSYKISKRYQNAHAYVNAAFLFKVDGAKKVDKPRIVYGGINSHFIHAKDTETFLQGKSLRDAGTIKSANETLDKEVNPEHVITEGAPAYKKNLTMALFYKTILSVLGTDAAAKVRSGAVEIERKVTSGKRDFDTDKADWPVGQPIHKLESYAQVSGEAEYTNDIHQPVGELFGSLVLSTVAKADLISLDASEALQIPGVVAFISAKDIPGKNSYMSDWVGPSAAEEIFASSKIHFCGSSLGLILAETREIALRAVKKVHAKYANVQKPVLDIKTSLELAEETHRWVVEEGYEGKTTQIKDFPHKIKGEFKLGWQYHFTMETQSVLVIPKEDSTLDVYPSSQYIQHVQVAIADSLNLPHHNINIKVKRIGGGYGSKISRGTIVHAACAIGAFLTNRPVRMVLDLEDNMELIGKRLPYHNSYEVGFDDTGKILDAKISLICDAGFQVNEVTSGYAKYFIQNCYNPETWMVKDGTAVTNTHGNTWARAPGSTEAISTIETILEHISRVLKKDPLEVRTANFIQAGNPTYYITPDIKFEGVLPIPKMMDQIMASSDYKARRAAATQFNTEHRWKKRGMSIVPMRYAIHYGMWSFPVYLTTYHQDGSVAIAHSGIEMGQGMNTKVAQVAAKTLGIPITKIKIKAANNLTGANASITGGAVTSELVSYSTMKACQILLARMAPIKAKLGKDATWERIVSQCYREAIELSSSYLLSPRDGLKSYDVYAINIIEVEIDVLTGEMKIVRDDLIEDAGKSLSPEVDIGQIEGALMMGIGYWTTEKIIFDPENGKMLTNNTWQYKVPLVKDIPEIFNVTMLKNAPNPFGVLRSKATGEPPLCMGVSVMFALRDAIDSARRDAGATEPWFEMHGPISPEDIVRYCMTSKSQFII